MKSAAVTIAKAALIVVAVAIIVGYYLGMADAKAVEERLRPLWPDIETMEQQDRALLGALAFECDLLRRADSAAETLDCLRTEARSQRLKQPQADPLAHLERLIERATTPKKG